MGPNLHRYQNLLTILSFVACDVIYYEFYLWGTVIRLKYKIEYKTKNKILEIERENTRCHTVENSLWKGLWTCRKAENRMKDADLKGTKYECVD